MDEMGTCPDCNGVMYEEEDEIFYCYHCCIKYKWAGCFYEYIDVIDNCW